MKRTLVGAVVAGVLGVVGLGDVPAGACDTPPHCEYRLVTCYETVVTYETKCVPYTKAITLYDKCGKPYEVTKTFYREVQVPVKKIVAVTRKVPVYNLN